MCSVLMSGMLVLVTPSICGFDVSGFRPRHVDLQPWGLWCSPFRRRVPRSCVDAPCDARELLNVWRCDRVRSCVRPVDAAFDMTAGRYGDARRGSISSKRARSPLTRCGFPAPDLSDLLSLRSTTSSHLPTSRRWRLVPLMRLLPWSVPGSPLFSLPWPRSRAPSYWRERR